MIWHLPEDLKHFKATTLGKPIIMGRKSYEALGKPLPGRPNIIISRTDTRLPDDKPTRVFKDMEREKSGPDNETSTHRVKSIEEAIALGKDIAASSGVDEIFITGGGEIYRQTLPITQRLYLTILDREYEGDTFFPEINREEWSITSERKHEANPDKDRPAFTIFTLERK